MSSLRGRNGRERSQFVPGDKSQTSLCLVVYAGVDAASPVNMCNRGYAHVSLRQEYASQSEPRRRQKED